MSVKEAPDGLGSTVGPAVFGNSRPASGEDTMELGSKSGCAEREKEAHLFLGS